MATQEQEQRIKVETARIVLKHGGQGIHPNFLETLFIAKEIKGKGHVELKGLTLSDINDVIAFLGKPFDVTRSSTKPSTIKVNTALAAHDVVSKLAQRTAVKLTKDHSKSIKEAVIAADDAVKKVKEALKIVEGLHALAMKYAADAELAAKQAQESAQT